MRLPDDVARLFRGAPTVDAIEQAFPFLTVDDDGFPRTALLSRAELGVRIDRHAIIAVVTSPGTSANLERNGRAGLIAVHGSVAHHLTLRVQRSRRHAGLLACELVVLRHRRDTVGVPLTPLGYRPTADLARAEHWGLSARFIRLLGGAGGAAGEGGQRGTDGETRPHGEAGETGDD